MHDSAIDVEQIYCFAAHSTQNQTDLRPQSMQSNILYHYLEQI